MTAYSNEYKHIRKQAEDWPEWKKNVYDHCVAISAHAIKLSVNKEKQIEESLTKKETVERWD